MTRRDWWLGFVSAVGLMAVSLGAQVPPPDPARFVIVQSTLAAKWTFRLDRYTGQTDLLVRTANGDNAWDAMEVVDRPSGTSAKPRFQIFTSTLAARFTFLIDGDSGRTWQLVTVKRKAKDGSEIEIYLWEPFVP